MATKKRRVPTNPTGKGGFKKGNPGGPGRPRVTPEELAQTRLTSTRFKAALRKYLNLSMPEIMALLKDPTTKSLDLMILSVLARAIKDGDEKRLGWILEKLFGRSKEQIDVNLTQSKKVVVIPSNNRQIQNAQKQIVQVDE